MKKIIHFSDLHIGYGDLEERFIHTIQVMNALKRPQSNYVVVIAGDLVERAMGDNYEIAGELVKYMRDLGYTVLAVPGNHDYARLMFHWKRNVKKFKKNYFGDETVTYPKLDILGGEGEKIAFMGLDSMAEELHFYDSMWANGELGKKQLGRLKDMLYSEEVEHCAYKVVYLHHHPFEPISNTHKLKDADDLCNLLMGYNNDVNGRHRIDALLFGHNHFGKKWNGYLGIPRCYDGGSTTRKGDGPVEHRVIDLSRDAALDYDGDFLRGYPID